MQLDQPDRLSTPPPLIDPRSYQQLVDLIRVKRLGEVDPLITTYLGMININRPGNADLVAWNVLQERVQAILGALQERPFLPPPPTMTDGEVILGIAHNGQLVRTAWHNLARHALITAASGGGKTNFTHFLLHQALRDGKRVWILDAKRDASYLPAHYPMLVASALRYNPLERPAFITPSDHVAMIASCFCRAFFGHETLKGLITELLKSLFNDNQSASIADFKRHVDEHYSVKDTYSRRDANRALAAKVARLVDSNPAIATTNHGIPAELLCSHSVLFDVRLLTEADDFWHSLAVHQLFAFQQSTQARGDLDVLLVQDEGLLSFGNETTSTTNSRISGPALGALHGMIREFNLGMLLTTTSIRALTPTVKTSVYLHAAMGLSDGSEADEITKTYGLAPEQREYLLRQLKLGETIIRLNDDRWRYPMLLQIPRLDPGMKTVTSEQWQAAIDRTKRFSEDAIAYNATTAPLHAHLTAAPNDKIAYNTNVAEDASQTRNATTAPPSENPTVAPDHTMAYNTTAADAASQTPNRPRAADEQVAPNTDTPPAQMPSRPTPPRPVALSVAEEALLRTVAKETITTVSNAYKIAKLPAMVGNRAAEKLLALGLITKDPIVVKPGKGGAAQALQPTAEGWSRINQAPPHGIAGRGPTSPQHRFLTVHFAARIPDAMIELSLGGANGTTPKSLDLCFRITPKHDRVMSVIASNAHHLAQQPAPLSPGDLVALEVEVSSPAKTASRNALADLAVGAALVAIAVMPKIVEKTKRELLSTLPTAALPRVVVADALELLAALPPTRQGDVTKSPTTGRD